MLPVHSDFKPFPCHLCDLRESHHNTKTPSLVCVVVVGITVPISGDESENSGYQCDLVLTS